MEENRKPWWKRQQNIFTFIGVVMAVLGLFLDASIVDKIFYYIGIGLPIIANIIGENWRDVSQFNNAWEFIEAADDEEDEEDEE